MNDNQFKLKKKTKTFLLFAVWGWMRLLRFSQPQVTVSSEGRLTYQQGGVATTHDANEEKKCDRVMLQSAVASWVVCWLSHRQKHSWKCPLWNYLMQPIHLHFSICATKQKTQKVPCCGIPKRKQTWGGHAASFWGCGLDFSFERDIIRLTSKIKK